MEQQLELKNQSINELHNRQNALAKEFKHLITTTVASLHQQLQQKDEQIGVLTKQIEEEEENHLLLSACEPSTTPNSAEEALVGLAKIFHHAQKTADAYVKKSLEPSQAPSDNVSDNQSSM
ncbi:MAG: hypothetical protein GX096_00765 [Clostridiales bacterium]|nr:hypothetical protein [Clostridiales bacterium]